LKHLENERGCFACFNHFFVVVARVVGVGIPVFFAEVFEFVPL